MNHRFAIPTPSKLPIHPCIMCFFITGKGVCANSCVGVRRKERKREGRKAKKKYLADKDGSLKVSRRYRAYVCSCTQLEHPPIQQISVLFMAVLMVTMTT